MTNILTLFCIILLLFICCCGLWSHFLSQKQHCSQPPPFCYLQATILLFYVIGPTIYSFILLFKTGEGGKGEDICIYTAYYRYSFFFFHLHANYSSRSLAFSLKNFLFYMVSLQPINYFNFCLSKNIFSLPSI